MRLLVLGGTGRVGRLVVSESVKRGHEITVLSRSPDASGRAGAHVRVMPGDALDSAAVSPAVAGQDAVAYVLGTASLRQTTLFSESTRILLGEMHRHAVRRLVCVTGVGAGDTRGHGGFWYDHVIYPLFTKRLYDDKDRQEVLIRQSGLAWTVVRPAPFRTHAPPGSLRAVTTTTNVTLRGVSRLEVATFLIDELEQNRYVRQAVFIGHE